MRHGPIAGLAILATLPLAACQPADPVPAELTPEETEAIRAVSDAFEQAASARDWDSVAALYTEDAIVMPPNGPEVTGRAAIRDLFASFPPITSVDLEVQEIVGRGDLAYVRGSYTMELAPEGAPEPIRDSGKFIEIRRRQPDGSWPLSRDIFNSSRPAPNP